MLCGFIHYDKKCAKIYLSDCYKKVWFSIYLFFIFLKLFCHIIFIFIKVQFLKLLSVLMKIHPIPHAIFETTRSGFIQILHHCSVPWNINCLYFCRQKEPIEVKSSDFWVVGWRFTKFSCHIWNQKPVFLQTLHHSSVSWEITPPYFISWNFIS